MDPIVEEGCSQLVAYYFLGYILNYDYKLKEDSEQKKRVECLQHNIEHDSSLVYGDGFLIAKKYFEMLGGTEQVMGSFLQHVVMHHCFPHIL